MRLDRWAGGLVVATWGLLVLGASVRVHGAGLACPDWPLCFGEVIPRIDFGVALEFGHRVVAGVISLGFLVLGGMLWAHRRTVGTRALVVWGLAAATLVVQIVLGGLTVLELLAEWTVTSHLVTGNTFNALLFVLTLVLGRASNPTVTPEPVTVSQRALATALAVLLPVQLALGGLLASSYAGLACGTWPTCDGVSYFPSWTGPVGVQSFHRVTAYALFGVAVVGVASSFGTGRVGQLWRLVLFTVTVQGAIGVANVLLRLPVEVTLLHSAGAAGAVLATTWLMWESWSAPVRAPAPSVLPPPVEAF